MEEARPQRSKLKKTLEARARGALGRSVLYSRKAAKTRKTGGRNVSSFSRLEVQPSLSSEGQRRRNISSKAAKVRKSRPKAKAKGKAKAKAKKRKKSRVVLTNIDNSQNVYNNFFINVKESPSARGQVNSLLQLIRDTPGQSNRGTLAAGAPVHGYMEKAARNHESRFLEESTQRLKNSIISVRQIFEENAGESGATRDCLGEAHLYRGKRTESAQTFALGGTKKPKPYNPFTITNGVSYDFEAPGKGGAKPFKKFSMSLKNVIAGAPGKPPGAFLKSQPTERRAEKGAPPGPEPPSEEFNMYRKKYFEAQGKEAEEEPAEQKAAKVLLYKRNKARRQGKPAKKAKNRRPQAKAASVQKLRASASQDKAESRGEKAAARKVFEIFLNSHSEIKESGGSRAKTRSPEALLKQSSNQERNSDFDKIRKMGRPPRRISPFALGLRSLKKRRREKLAQAQTRVESKLKTAHQKFLRPESLGRLLDEARGGEGGSAARGLPKKRGLRSLSLEGVKQMHQLQVLMDVPSLRVKSYFGCVSSFKFPAFLPVTPGDLQVSEDFVRSAAQRLEYAEDCLEDLPSKMRRAESFKLTRDFDAKDQMAFDERLRMTRDGIEDFGIDIFLYENFFDKVIEMRSVSKTKHYSTDGGAGGAPRGPDPKGPEKNFKKQDRPERDADFGGEGGPANGHRKRGHAAPQNSLEVKHHAGLGGGLKRIIKSFLIKPKRPEAGAKTPSPRDSARSGGAGLEEIGRIEDSEGAANPKTLSHKKCFSKILQQNLENDLQPASSRLEKAALAEDWLGAERPLQGQSSRELLVHFSNFCRETQAQAGEVPAKRDYFIKLPEAGELFEKSGLQSSKLEQPNSLMKTFYLYSFKDDMTLGNLTHADKDEYEIVQFHSRSLEDLSKFDWSGSGGTQNQSDLANQGAASWKLAVADPSRALDSLVAEPLVDLKSLKPLSKASHGPGLGPRGARGARLLPQNLKLLQKMKNRTETSFKFNLEKLVCSQTMKVLRIPKGTREGGQHSEIGESMMSNPDKGRRRIEIKSYCFQKSKDSINFCIGSQKMMETSGCRVLQGPSDNSSRVRNRLHNMVNPEAKGCSRDTLRFTSKKSIFSNLKKERAGPAKSNNCTLKYIASKNVSSIFEQLSKHRNTKVILESLQISANSNELLEERDFKQMKSFTLQAPPAPGKKPIHTFRRDSNGAEARPQKETGPAAREMVPTAIQSNQGERCASHESSAHTQNFFFELSETNIEIKETDSQRSRKSEESEKARPGETADLQALLPEPGLGAQEKALPAHEPSADLTPCKTPAAGASAKKPPPKRGFKKMKLLKRLSRKGAEDSHSRRCFSPKSSLAKKILQSCKLKNGASRKLARASKGALQAPSQLDLSKRGSGSARRRLGRLRAKTSFERERKIRSFIKNSSKVRLKEASQRKGHSLLNHSGSHVRDLFQSRAGGGPKTNFYRKASESEKRRAWRGHVFNAFADKKARGGRAGAKEARGAKGAESFSSIKIKNLNINLNFNFDLSRNFYARPRRKSPGRWNTLSDKLSPFQSIVKEKVLKATLDQQSLAGRLQKSRKRLPISLLGKRFKSSARARRAVHASPK